MTCAKHGHPISRNRCRSSYQKQCVWNCSQLHYLTLLHHMLTIANTARIYQWNMIGKDNCSIVHAVRWKLSKSWCIGAPLTKATPLYFQDDCFCKVLLSAKAYVFSLGRIGSRPSWASSAFSPDRQADWRCWRSGLLQATFTSPPRALGRCKFVSQCAWQRSLPISSKHLNLKRMKFLPFDRYRLLQRPARAIPPTE